MSAPAPAARQAGFVVKLFLAFASAYFLSTLVRAVTATLAPVFSRELGLTSADLGLLAGAYFASFALAQLPVGSALDRWGPRRVLVGLLCLAVAGCWAFSLAASLQQLILARLLTGVGLAACLMAALTCFSHWLPAALQLRASSWMLMTGSLGMLTSTLPVQWLLPLVGWRGLFQGVGALLLLSIFLVLRWVPERPAAAAAETHRGHDAAVPQGYREVFLHPVFIRFAPIAVFVYGGLLAMQSLWIGPWLTQVSGRDAAGAAAGLFSVNLAMMFAFLSWGLATPWLAKRGVDVERLVKWLLPLSLALLMLMAWRGAGTGAVEWVAWCVCCSVATLTQPMVGRAFPAALAGRALSAYNLLVFAGVFLLQWGIGGLLDLLTRQGLSTVDAFRVSAAVLALCCLFAYGWMWRVRPEPARAGSAAAG